MFLVFITAATLALVAVYVGVYYDLHTLPNNFTWIKSFYSSSKKSADETIVTDKKTQFEKGKKIFFIFLTLIFNFLNKNNLFVF